MACKLSLVCLMVASLAILSAPTANGDPQCIVEWHKVMSFNNGLSTPITRTHTIKYGVKTVQQTTRTESHSTTVDAGAELGLAKKILSISVSLSTSVTHSKTVTTVSGRELTMEDTKTLSIPIAARTSATLWQLRATYNGYSVNFHETQLLPSDQHPSTKDTNCEVQKKQRILSTTNVRLRHKESGLYLNTIRRKKWEAATLGSGTHTLFRIQPVRNTHDAVRVIVVHPMYAGYDAMYSSNQGGVFFDWERNSQKQMWRISNTELRNGDSVTFRNSYWQSAGLVKHTGPASNVYCITQMTLDEWVVEIA